MRKFKHKVHDFGRDPYIDWATITSITAIIMIVVIVIGVISYINLDSKLSSSNSSASQSRSTIDSKSLDKVMAEFDERATRHSSLIKSYSGPADPSL